jgi:hypothetical protein
MSWSEATPPSDSRQHGMSRTLNAFMTATYWEIGRRIVEFEQGGARRAGYGEEVLNRLAADLTTRLGRGFSRFNLGRFLNLRDEYSETDLEDALIRHLEAFLLELGNDFAFIGRQRRLRIDDEWYRVDLLFFHHKVHHWPGVESLTAIDHDLPLVATKPLSFFDQNNKDLPELLELRFARAPGFEHLSHDEYTKLLRDEVAKAEKAAAEERREKGIKIVGRASVLKQHWNAKPSTREPRRGMSPRVTCKNKWARIEALQRSKAFIEQYREARAAKLAGQDGIFPAGTWWLHRFAA